MCFSINLIAVSDRSSKKLPSSQGRTQRGGQGGHGPPQTKIGGGQSINWPPPNVNDLNHKKLDYIVNYSIFFNSEDEKSENFCAFGAVSFAKTENRHLVPVLGTKARKNFAPSAQYCHLDRK